MVINPPVQGYLIAKKGRSGQPTTLQRIISEAMAAQKVVREAFAGLPVGAGSGTAGSGSAGALEALNKPSVVTVMDINREPQ